MDQEKLKIAIEILSEVLCPDDRLGCYPNPKIEVCYLCWDRHLINKVTPVIDPATTSTPKSIIILIDDRTVLLTQEEDGWYVGGGYIVNREITYCERIPQQGEFHQYGGGSIAPVRYDFSIIKGAGA